MKRKLFLTAQFTRKSLLFFTTVCFTCLLPSSKVLAQLDSRYLLTDGVRQYHAAKFDSARITLKQSIKIGFDNLEELVEAYKFLAFSYIAIGDEVKAKYEFFHILEKRPRFKLASSESPKLSNVFKSAMREFRRVETEPPEIIHSPPSETVTDGSSLILKAKIGDNIGLTEVKLYYRFLGQKNFRSVEMNSMGESNYSYELRARPKGLEYYIEATDFAGNKAFEYDNASPRIVLVKAKPATWTASRIALTGGGVTSLVVFGLVVGRKIFGKDDTQNGDSRLPDPPGPPADK